MNNKPPTIYEPPVLSKYPDHSQWHVDIMELKILTGIERFSAGIQGAITMPSAYYIKGTMHEFLGTPPATLGRAGIPHQLPQSQLVTKPTAPKPPIIYYSEPVGGLPVIWHH